MTLDEKTEHALAELKNLIPELRDSVMLTPNNRITLRRLIGILGDEDDLKIFDICTKYRDAVVYEAIISMAEDYVRRYERL